MQLKRRTNIRSDKWYRTCLLWKVRIKPLLWLIIPYKWNCVIRLFSHKYCKRIRQYRYNLNQSLRSRSKKSNLQIKKEDSSQRAKPTNVAPSSVHNRFLTWDSESHGQPIQVKLSWRTQWSTSVEYENYQYNAQNKRTKFHNFVQKVWMTL